jgi:recombination protein RecT
MTTQELAIIEQTLRPLTPHFAEALRPSGIAPERLVRTVLVSLERMPSLISCDRQSIINAAMSAAVLGLEVDGVTGQAYLIPFQRRAQLVIGYKGFNTLAARSGITINGSVVREGDAFEYQLGTGGYIRHRPKLTDRGRIVAAYAYAESRDRPPIIGAPLSIDDIMAIKDKSPGSKRSESPWNDPDIGFPAMAEKSAKRRLARAMPLNVMTLAARMDEAHEEQGLHAWVHPTKGVQVEGEAVVLVERDNTKPKLERPRYLLIGSDGTEVEKATVEQWQSALSYALQRIPSAERLAAFNERHRAIFDGVRAAHPKVIAQIERSVADLDQAFKVGA